MSGPFTANYTVEWYHADEADADDGYGNPEITYTPPLDQPGTPTKVYSWAPPGSARERQEVEQRVIHDLDLYVPVGTVGGPLDVVRLPDGLMYEVSGWPQDFTTSPFTPGLGGLLVQLKRTTR